MEQTANIRPVRRRLCERPTDWQWSGARAYETGARTNEASPPDPVRIDLDSLP